MPSHSFQLDWIEAGASTSHHAGTVFGKNIKLSCTTCNGQSCCRAREGDPTKRRTQGSESPTIWLPGFSKAHVNVLFVWGWWISRGVRKKKIFKKHLTMKWSKVQLISINLQESQDCFCYASSERLWTQARLLWRDYLNTSNYIYHVAHRIIEVFFPNWRIANRQGVQTLSES